MKLLRYAMILLLGAGAFAACSNDDLDPVEKGSNRIEGVMTLNVPAGSFEMNHTRSLTAADEHYIKEVDVLVFNESGGSKFFYEKVQATMIDGTSELKSFKVSFTPTTDPVQFVVIANARAMIGGLSLNTSMSRDNVLAALEMSLTSGSGWNSTTGAYDPLPMWGQTDFAVRTDAASVNESVDMLRSLARVDVNVATAAQAKFAISNVTLYNSSLNGRIAPSDAAWVAADKAVNAVSLPTTPAKNSALSYAVTGGSLERTIYTFEAAAATSSADMTAPYLIIAGSYDGGATSYYRVDFFDSANSAYLNLMRNHLYNVVISEVGGPGYASVSEAASASFTNLTATTQQWDEGGMGSVVWDGRNMLAVSRNQFDIYKEADPSLDVKVSTNYSTGWSAAVAANAASWLSISGSATGAANTTATLQLAAAVNNSGADRSGVVTITAGRLMQTITVNQGKGSLISLEVGDVEMIFPSTVTADQKLRIEWMPKTSNCVISYHAVANYTGCSFSNHDVSGSKADAGISNSTAAIDLAIHPNDATLAAFAEKRRIIRATVTNSNGDVETKDVLIRQFDYAIAVTSGKMAGDRYQPGTTYSLKIRSNARWKFELPTNSAIEYVKDVTGDPSTDNAGETVYFKTTLNLGATTTIRFVHEDNPAVYVDVPVIVARNEPNCVIVDPSAGNNVIDIPVSKAFWVWATDIDLGSTVLDGNTANWGAQLMWQDAQNLIASVTPVWGTNEHDSFIRVTTNTSGIEGNAVVAFTIGSGADKIKWSWHVWVLKNYDPTANTGYNSKMDETIMDRNLGAINTTPGDVGSCGLVYQWGRKDPFTGSANMVCTSRIDSTPIYDINNVQLVEQADGLGPGINTVQVAAAMNLDNAIYNPMTLYHDTSSGTDLPNWYTNIPYILGVTTVDPGRASLWGGSFKTEFDPCPEGWMIPRGHILNYTPIALGDYVTGVGVTLTDVNGSSLGFFPPNSYRVSNGVAVPSSGIATRIWRAGHRGIMYISDGSIVSTSTHAAHGMGARCVRVK